MKNSKALDILKKVLVIMLPILAILAFDLYAYIQWGYFAFKSTSINGEYTLVRNGFGKCTLYDKEGHEYNGTYEPYEKDKLWVNGYLYTFSDKETQDILNKCGYWSIPEGYVRAENILSAEEIDKIKKDMEKIKKAEEDPEAYQETELIQYQKTEKNIGKYIIETYLLGNTAVINEILWVPDTSSADADNFYTIGV